MDVIKITISELRDMARHFRLSAENSRAAMAMALDSDDRETFRDGAHKDERYQAKLAKLADKLERDNMDALAFCAPAQGVQA